MCNTKTEFKLLRTLPPIHVKIVPSVYLFQDDQKEEGSGSNGKTSEVGDGDKASDPAPATIEEVSGKITKWRIENSWGEERNNKARQYFVALVSEIKIDSQKLKVYFPCNFSMRIPHSCKKKKYFFYYWQTILNICRGRSSLID